MPANQDSELLRLGFMAVGMSGDMDGADRVLNHFTEHMEGEKATPNKVRIPTAGSLRALDAWGIPHVPTEGITRMFGSVPCVEAELPAGWRVDRRGQWTHLYDDLGRERLRWYLHGWDPVDVQVMNRFGVTSADLGQKTLVFQVKDGETVIHVVHCDLPHARVSERMGGSLYWDLPENATREARGENYKAREASSREASDWLEKNRPNWRDNLKSWDT